jgi:hypothetical protein
MLEKSSPSLLRQQWLHEAEMELRALFKSKGYDVPAEVRVSIGWPKGTRDGKMAIGQCWALEASKDSHSEIFISPQLGHTGQKSVKGSIVIFGVLAHELGHAIAGNKAGHRIIKRPAEEKGRKWEKWRKSFPAIMESIGIEGPWTATTEGPEFIAWVKPIIERIGTFPAGALVSNGRKKDKNRQRKCTCEACGYIARTTKKWIETAGAPFCPTHKKPMVCEEIDEDDEGDED